MAPKILLSRVAIEKLVARFREVLREPTEKDGVMLRWFDEQLSDTITPVDRVLKHLGTLKPGWERALSQVEMHELHGSLDTLRDFTDGEWQTIRDYLAYTPKSWEKLYQVKSRLWFLQQPVDTLTASETWKDARKPRKTLDRVASALEGNGSYPADFDVKATMDELFAGFRSLKPEENHTDS